MVGIPTTVVLRPQAQTTIDIPPSAAVVMVPVNAITVKAKVGQAIILNAVSATDVVHAKRVPAPVNSMVITD